MKYLWPLACVVVGLLLLATGVCCLGATIGVIISMGDNPAGFLGYLVTGAISFWLLVLTLCSWLAGVSTIITALEKQ